MDTDLARLLDDELACPSGCGCRFCCVMRELTMAQAAREFGWPVGTVAGRLSRGRAALALAGVPALARMAPAAVPPELVSKTIAAVAAGGAGSPAVVLSLATEVTSVMGVQKLKLVCLGLFAAVAVAVSGGLVFTPAVAAPVPRAEGPAPDPLDRVRVERLAALLKIEEVRKDLGLTDEQAKAIDDARGEAERDVKAAVQQAVRRALPGGGLPANGGQVIHFSGGEGVNEAVEKAAKGVLRADQLRQLKQISGRVRCSTAR